MTKTRTNVEKSKSHPVEFSILRQRPQSSRPPAFQSFQVNVDAEMTVLDALERIRLTLDDTLMYRHSCHHSACGTCACMVNGVQRPACTTRVHDLNSETVVLEPLRGFKCLGDLVVDMTDFYRDLDPDWSLLKPAEPIPEASLYDEQEPLRLEDCIECGACVSACPVTDNGPPFMGPSALAALDRERLKRPRHEARDLLDRAAGPDGEHLCDRALACSRVCPTGVYPARHIADLRNELKRRS